jgi:hypothetical protein
MEEENTTRDQIAVALLRQDKGFLTVRHLPDPLMPPISWRRIGIMGIWILLTSAAITGMCLAAIDLFEY